MEQTPFQQALDFIDQFPIDDQEALLEIVRQRLIEQRRVEIAANAKATLRALQDGHAHVGTLDDLRRDLFEDV